MHLAAFVVLNFIVLLNFDVSFDISFNILEVILISSIEFRIKIIEYKIYVGFY